MFLNHLPHSCFAVQMCLGCSFTKNGWHGVGGPRILWILLDAWGSTVRLCGPKSWSQLCRVTEWSKSHPCSPQRDLSPFAPQGAGAKLLGLPCSVLRFAGSCLRVIEAREPLCIWYCSIAFWLEKRSLSFCHCCYFRASGGCGSLQWPVPGCAALAVQSRFQDSRWVLPPPGPPEAVGLGDGACHFSLLPLQGRDCLTLVVYTAPSTMSALNIN